MGAAFDRDALLEAFDQIGRAAALAGTKLQIAVYGGSALMLVSNFRFATDNAQPAAVPVRVESLVLEGPTDGERQRSLLPSPDSCGSWLCGLCIRKSTLFIVPGEV